MTSQPAVVPAASRSYLKWTIEQIAILEIENKSKGIARFGFRNLAIFCEHVGLNEKAIRVAMKAATKKGERSTTMSGWTFHWMSIEEWREAMKKKSVVLAPYIRKVHGKGYANRNECPKEELAVCDTMHRLMS